MLDTLMYVHNNLLFFVDIENKSIKDIYKGNNLIQNEASFEEICDIFANTFDLVDTFRPKLLRFLNNLNPSEGPFELSINYEKTDGTPTTIIYKGLKVSKTKVLLTISNELLIAQSNVDGLTKCLTRKFFLERVKEAISDKKEFILLLLDIDNFKHFNETYGHMFGDMILIETAAAIKKFVKNNGYVARVGGDMFMIILFIENEYDKIHDACKELRREVSALNGKNIKNASLSATLGCAVFPQDADNYELLREKCIVALNRGKAKGRNCFVIYTEERCGKVTLDTVEKNDPTKTMDKNIYSVNNYNIVSGVIELLNRAYSFKENALDCLSLIGNYFLLDRIALCVLKPDTQEVNYSLEWHSPLIETSNIVFSKDNIEAWRKSYDKIEMLKVNQMASNKALPVYSLLESQGTSAIVAFELEHENKTYGQIRFDMCSTNRFWQSTDVSAFMLIAKNFAIKLQSEYLSEKHYNELYIDKLTGVYNFNKWLIDTKRDNNETHDPYSICTLKIVDFPSLQTIFGSNECNKMIKRIAKWSIDNAEGGIFARLTNESFTLYTKILDIEYTKKNLGVLYDYIISTGHSKLNGIRVRVGVFLSDGTDDIEDALDKAIFARDTENSNEDLVVYTDELYNEALEMKSLELHIEEALKNDEFLLYIQPKINANTSEIAAAEALTRWNYKFRQIIPPYKFIPLFEKLGYITELDYRVFENVCKFIRSIIDRGYKPFPISVNVSRYTTDYDGYIKTINSIRNKYEISPELIELEITEGMYTENVDDIKRFVDMLRREGYIISIDDFGSGYSNLNNISKLDFEILKLDKSLCSLANEESVIVLDAIIKTAKKTGHVVVCEGVETEHEYAVLRDLGADLIQGYYFDRPLEKYEFEKKYVTKK